MPGPDTELPSVQITPTPLDPSYRKAGIMCGLAAALLGTLGLAGLVLGIPILTSIVPVFKPIAFSASVGWIILGLVLAFFLYRPLRGILRDVITAGILIISVVAAIELPLNIMGDHFLVEHFFLKAGNVFFPIPSTPVSPLAVILILISSAALLLLLVSLRLPAYGRQLRNGAGILGSGVVLLGFTILLSYLYGKPFLYGTVLIPIAIPSALAGLFTGISLIAAAGPESVPFSIVTGTSIRAQLLRLLLPLIVIIIFVQNYLEGVISGFPVVENSILVTILLIVFVIIAGFVVGKISGVFSRNLEDEQQRRQKAEDAGRETREYLTNLIRYANAPIITWNPEFRITEFNRAFETLTGLSRERVIGQPLRILFPKESCEASMIRIRSASAGEKWEVVEIPILHNSGMSRTVLWNSATIAGPDGRVIATIAQGTDITERKVSELALIRSEQRLRRFYESGLFGVIFWTMDGKITDANDKFLSMVGYTREDLVAGRIDWVGMTPPRFRDLDERSTEELKSTGTNSIPFEKEYIRKDGRHLPILIAGAMLDERRFEGVAFVLDITERTRAEEALRASEEEYHSIIENMQDAYFRADAAGIIIMANPSAALMYGYESPKAMTGIHAAALYRSKKDREDMFRLLNENGRVTDYPGQGRRKDGSTFWVSLNVKVTFDMAGKITMSEGFVRDVTERKNTEEALRESEARFRQFFEKNNAVMIMLDPENGAILDANPSAAVLTGYSREVLRTMNIGEINQLPPEEIILYRRQVEEGILQFIVAPFRRADGSVRPVEVHSSPVRVGGKTYLFSIIHDITERLEAEEALKKSEEQYRTLFETMTEGFAYCRMIYTSENQPEDFIYLTVNPAFDRIIGTKTVTGRRVTEVFPGIRDAYPALFEIYGRVALTGNPEAFELDFKPSAKWLRIAVYSPAREYFVAVFEDITDRKLAEESLRQTNEYLRNLLDYANAPIIVWDPGFRITRFNHAFEHLTGRTEQEVVGKDLTILFPEASRDVSLELIRKTLTGERWEVVEIPILTVSGETRIVLWNSANIMDPEGRIISIIAQGQDITDRKLAEESLRQTNEYLRNLLDYANAPIIVWDPGFRITRFNHAFEHLTGRTEQEVVGKDLTILFPEASRDVSLELIRKTLTGERWEVVEIPILTVSSETRIVLWNSANIVDPEGRIISIIAQGQDITDRKLTEAQREALIRELEQKNAELERFTYTVSHDLKSPLITIQGFAGMVEDDARKGDPVQMKKDLLRITSAAGTMQTLLSDLLELSKVGRIVGPMEKIGMGTLAREAVSLLAIPLAEHRVTVEIAPDLPVVDVDHTRIREVFVNLIENAIKFLGDRPDPVIRIGTEWKEGIPIFFVQDNGIGINPRYLERIFNLFEKLDSGSPGTGIGLTIVRRIIEFHGGKIWAESEGPGKGTTFKFTLPGVPGKGDEIR